MSRCCSASTSSGAAWPTRCGARSARPDARSGVGHHVTVGRRIQVPALLAGAVFARGIEAIEHRREVELDVPELEEFLVQLRIGLLAEPQQAVELVRQALAFDDQADR